MQVPFTKFPNSALFDKRLDGHDKLVLLALLHWEVSFPSYNKLTELTGLKRTKIYMCVKKLEGLGYFDRKKNYRSSPTYVFNQALVGKRASKKRDSRGSPHEPQEEEWGTGMPLEVKASLQTKGILPKKRGTE
jgi:hypothetical protein